MWFYRLVIGIFLVAGLAMFGAGVYRGIHEQTDPRTLATVTDCSSIGGGSHDEPSTECLGTWTAAGKQVAGIVTGVSKHDVGKQVKVTVSGDSAFTVSLVLPLVLLGLGGACLVGGFVFFRMSRQISAGPSKGRPTPATA